MIQLKTLKSVIKYAIIGLLTLFILFYGTLALFIWWSDQTYRTDRKLTRSIHSRVKKPHKVTLVNDGLTSFAQRLKLIRQAQKSIELEFFIYEIDFASQIFTHELITAAKRGVKVRLLVDFAAPVFKLAPLYATFLNQHSIEVKYYNTSPAYSFINLQHRNHRKLLLIDDKIAMTGGRNIGNDYFNLSPRYNFLDSDIIVEGPVVKAIERSFELYWASELATSPPPGITDTDQVKQALNFFKTNKKLSKAKARLAQLSEQKTFKLSSKQCNDLEYVTDFPGVTHEYRRVFQVLSRILKNAKKNLLGETPYFVIRPGGEEILRHLQQQKIKTEILTNNLYATDAWYTISALHGTLDQLAETGLNLFVYNGSQPASFKALDGLLPSKRWGIHAKRAVIDDKVSIIGTYNIDPRSANLNSELLLICHNGPALAGELQADIRLRMQNSLPLIQAGEVENDHLFARAGFSDVLLTRLAHPLVNLFEFLL